MFASDYNLYCYNYYLKKYKVIVILMREIIDCDGHNESVPTNSVCFNLPISNLRNICSNRANVQMESGHWMFPNAVTF